MGVMMVGSAAVVAMRAMSMNIQVVRVLKLAMDMVVLRVETVQGVILGLL
jgi:hypothetical protein